MEGRKEDKGMRDVIRYVITAVYGGGTFLNQTTICCSADDEAC